MSNKIPYSLSGPTSHASVFLLILVGLLELFLLVGCGASPQASTNASQTPLTISPATIDFGMMMPGSQPSTYPVTLMNTGPNTVSIDSIAISPKGVFSLHGLNRQISLRWAQTISLEVMFAPTGTGTYSGALTVHSTEIIAPVLSPLNVTSKASGSSPTLNTIRAINPVGRDTVIALRAKV